MRIVRSGLCAVQPTPRPRQPVSMPRTCRRLTRPQSSIFDRGALRPRVEWPNRQQRFPYCHRRPCHDRRGRYRTADVDVVHRCAEHGGGDLSMDRIRTVAEFGGADDELVVAVRGQRHACLGEMSTRRHGMDHAECGALPDKPVAGWRRIETAAAVDRFPDQSQALIETMAVINDIGLPRRPIGTSDRPDARCCERETRSDPFFESPAPFRPSRTRRQRLSAAGHSREKHRRGECWCRHGIAVDFLVRTAIDRDRFAASCVHNVSPP